MQYKASLALFFQHNHTKDQQYRFLPAPVSWNTPYRLHKALQDTQKMHNTGFFQQASVKLQQAGVKRSLWLSVPLSGSPPRGNHLGSSAARKSSLRSSLAAGDAFL